MNRFQRRAVAKASKHANAAPDALGEKSSRRLAPQACVLYAPALRSYVAEFSGNRFLLVDLPEMAQIFAEDEASGAAIAFREISGQQVAVRPFQAQRSSEMQQLLRAIHFSPAS